MAVPEAHFLFAVRWAHTRIHVEHDASWRTTTMNAADPMAGKIGERQKVRFLRQHLRLEAAHLACRGCANRGRFAADHPAHRRIVTPTLGIVHILVSGEPTENRLPEKPDKCMAAILARARVGEQIACNHGQAKHVIKFAIGQQSSEVTTEPQNWSIRCSGSQNHIQTSGYSTNDRVLRLDFDRHRRMISECGQSITARSQRDERRYSSDDGSS